MSAYAEMDKKIVAAIDMGKNPLYWRDCEAEAKRLEAATGRESFRIIDGRLQALRKAGKIQYLTSTSKIQKVGLAIIQLRF